MIKKLREQSTAILSLVVRSTTLMVKEDLIYFTGVEMMVNYDLMNLLWKMVVNCNLINPLWKVMVYCELATLLQKRMVKFPFDRPTLEQDGELRFYELTSEN